MKKYFTTLVIVMAAFIMIKCGNADQQSKNAVSSVPYLADTAIYNSYMKMGSDYAAQTGAVLIKHLTEAIAKKGQDYAIGFCNTKALQLTDSMASVQNIFIKRVTDKARNPSNTANAEELQFIEQLKNLVVAGEKPMPRLQEIDGKVVGFYPILTNQMCMQCHGEKSNIAPKTLAALHKLYPADSATGYKPGELRGLWVVEMTKK